MSSQTEINTNNRSTTDNSVKKVRKESSKKVQKEVESGEREVESGEQDENSVSTPNSYFNPRPELPNMSQSNKTTISSANSEKKIRKSKVSANDQDSTNTISSQMTKPVQPNWNEATAEEKEEYRQQSNKYKIWLKKQKANPVLVPEPVPVQLKDEDEQSADEEEQPSQSQPEEEEQQSQSQPEEVPVDPSVEDQMEQDQKQDDEEQDQLIGTDQLTASTMEVSVPFPQQTVEPLSAMDGFVRDDALKPMSSPPSQDVPLSVMDFEEETSKPSGDEPSRAVQFQEEEQQECCMICREILGDRKVSKCSFCSGHLCLGACREKIIAEKGNSCPQCRKKYYRTEEEIELDDLEAEEQERRRQFDLRRLECLRRQKVQEQMNRANELRQQKFADLETRKQEMRERHQREMADLLAEEQRLTCMTDDELVAQEVQAIPDASLITPERRAAIAPMRSTTPSRARGRSPARARATSPARARAPSPTPSNEGSRRGGSTAGRVKRTMTSMDIRVGDEFDLALPRHNDQSWRIICSSVAGNGSFQVIRSSNRPDIVGTTFSTGQSPFNAVFQEYVFSVGIPKQDRTPWKMLNKYRNGVCIGKQM